MITFFPQGSVVADIIVWMFCSHFQKMFAVMYTCDRVSKSTSEEDSLAGGDIHLAVKACPAFRDILFFLSLRKTKGEVARSFLFVCFRAKTPTQTESTNQRFSTKQ